MVRIISYIVKKKLEKKSMYEQFGAAYIEEDCGVEKEHGKSKSVGKDKYIFSSVFPNEEIMRKVDAIMAEGER
mgnify:CR=1 FL=1